MYVHIYIYIYICIVFYSLLQSFSLSAVMNLSLSFIKLTKTIHKLNLLMNSTFGFSIGKKVIISYVLFSFDVDKIIRTFRKNVLF